jgi:cysteine-rich repeat protein
MASLRWAVLSIFALCTLGPQLAQAQTSMPSSTAVNIPPSSVCGNGIIEAIEECDDGNNVMEDGCSAFCISEQVPAPPTTAGGDRLFKIWARHQNEPLSYTPTSLKSAERARTLSLKYTIIAYSLTPFLWFVTIPALIVTPSFGYWYLGDRKQARRMAGRRFLATSVGVSGVFLLAFAVESQNDAVAAAAVVSGVALIGGSIVTRMMYTFGDIYYMKKATARHNQVFQGLTQNTENTPITPPVYVPSSLPVGPPKP